MTNCRPSPFFFCSYYGLAIFSAHLGTLPLYFALLLLFFFFALRNSVHFLRCIIIIIIIISISIIIPHSKIQCKSRYKKTPLRFGAASQPTARRVKGPLIYFALCSRLSALHYYYYYFTLRNSV